jgi:tetratricopeptide (TPR) repeat protein
VDLLVETGRRSQAIEILNTALSRRPDNYNFSWTRGLIYQSMGNYDQAIASLTHANSLAPGEGEIYYNLGICYFNIGVEINETARKMRDNLKYQNARKQAKEEFREAVKWLEKAHDLDPSDQKTITKLYQLYDRLQMPEKAKAMEKLMK